MNWLVENWQSLAALGVVAITVLVFAVRLGRSRHKAGCGAGCSCDGAKLALDARKKG